MAAVRDDDVKAVGKGLGRGVAVGGRSHGVPLTCENQRGHAGARGLGVFLRNLAAFYLRLSAVSRRRERLLLDRAESFSPRRRRGLGPAV